MSFKLGLGPSLFCIYVETNLKRHSHTRVSCLGVNGNQDTAVGIKLNALHRSPPRIESASSFPSFSDNTSRAGLYSSDGFDYIVLK